MAIGSPVQFLNVKGPGPSANERFWDRITQSLGTGLSGGLESLANMKMQQLQQRQLAGGLQALMPGITPEQAQQLSGLPEPILREITKAQVGTSGNKQLLQQEKANLQQQKAFTQRNKGFNTRLDKRIEDDARLVDLAQQMRELANSGKVNFGFIGSTVPLKFQNSETQQFVAKSNEVADVLTTRKGGLASKYRLGTRQLSKPNIEYTLDANLKLLDDVMEHAAATEEENKIRQDIYDEYEGAEPPNLEKLVSDRIEEIYGRKKKNKPSNEKKEIVNWEEIPVGKKFRDTDNGKVYRRTPVGRELVKE